MNRRGPAPLEHREELDFIDASDVSSDAAPNAYATSQRPQGRKPNPYAADVIAAYFQSRQEMNKRKMKEKAQGGKGKEMRISEGSREDESDVPSWRGEAPSPLSPNPGTTPAAAFLRFGDGPLNYGLSLPNGAGRGETFNAFGGGFNGDGATASPGRAARCFRGSAISNRLKSYCTKFPFNNSDSNIPVEAMESDDTTLLVTCGEEGKVVSELVEVPSGAQAANMSTSSHSSLGRSQSLDDNLHVLSSQADASENTVSTSRVPHWPTIPENITLPRLCNSRCKRFLHHSRLRLGVRRRTVSAAAGQHREPSI